MNILVNVEESSIDKIDNIKVFLQFNSECLIIPMECMPVYGTLLQIIQKIQKI
jgi:hypothetical protein